MNTSSSTDALTCKQYFNGWALAALSADFWLLVWSIMPHILETEVLDVKSKSEE